MVKALACNSKCHEFDSRPFRGYVTTLGKLFTHLCLCRAATPANRVEAVVRSPTNMATAKIAAVDFNKMVAK